MNGLFWESENKQQYNPNQTEIQFFWPLTEQIPLDLDYTNCEKEKVYTTDYNLATTIAFHTPTWTTSVAPYLSVDPVNSVGYLSIGGVKVGLETKPNLVQKVLYKLLGFNWKKK